MKMIYLLLFIFLFFLMEYYNFIAFKTAFNFPYFNWCYISVNVLITGLLIYFMQNKQNVRNNQAVFFITSTLLLVFLPKLIVSIPLLIDDILRVIQWITGKTIQKHTIFPQRRRFISFIALGIASIPFISIIYGIFIGRYNFRVIRLDIEIDDLPDSFDGYQITQISDIHSGSFDNKEKIEYAIDLINEQKSDALFFTGDLVNSEAKEMLPYVDIFKKLEAKDGLFSVLGNHDYAEYGFKRNKDNRAENRTQLIEIHKQIGFDLLLNENRKIYKGTDSINIIGVENWGSSVYFPKEGDLFKATEGIQNNEFNILLSHDPSHFDFQKAEMRKSENHLKDAPRNTTNILNFKKKIHLTLSGHTHGMQFGIEIPWLNIKWSPVKYRYPKWAGLYQEKGRYLYVNRGFGYLAFPGRVGMDPEITVLKLIKKDLSKL